MRTIICTSVIALVAAPFSVAYDMTSVNTRLSAIVASKIPEIDSAVRIEKLNGNSDFTALKLISKDDWSAILDHLSSVNGGEVAKKVLFWSMADLTPANYASFLDKATTLFEGNTINSTLMEEALFPEGRMQDLVTDNYQHALIAPVLTRVKAKTTDNALIARLTSIQSGAAKTALDGFREGHQGLPEGDTPVITIPD